LYLQLQLSYFGKARWLDQNSAVDHIPFFPAGQTFDSARGGEAKEGKKKKKQKQIKVSKHAKLRLSTVAVSGTSFHLRHYKYPPIFFSVTSAKPLF
jgi:hypothetical protein